MAVTHTKTSAGYSGSTKTISCTEPSGTGGIFVAFPTGRDNQAGENLWIEPATPGDWNTLDNTIWDQSFEVHLQGAYWAEAGDSPDLDFTATGAGAGSVHLFRISDGAATPTVASNSRYSIFDGEPTGDLPDVTSAPAGTAVFVSVPRNPAYSSVSLGWTIHDGGTTNDWWDTSPNVAGSLESVSSGTFDAGTISTAADATTLVSIVVVVETGGGGPAPVTGTGTPTLADHSVTGSGSVTAPTSLTGTGSPTLADHTAAGTGTVTDPATAPVRVPPLSTITPLQVPAPSPMQAP